MSASALKCFLPYLGWILDFQTSLLLQAVTVHPDIRIVEGKALDGPHLFDDSRCSGKNSRGSFLS
jgi:hypothetical protein